MPYVVARTGGQDAQSRIASRSPSTTAPTRRWTPMILDTLRSRGVKATFFVVGQNVDTHLAPAASACTPRGTRSGITPIRIPNLALDERARATVLELDATTLAARGGAQSPHGVLPSAVLRRRRADDGRRARAGGHRVAAQLLDDRPARRLARIGRRSRPDSIIAQRARERERCRTRIECHQPGLGAQHRPPARRGRQPQRSTVAALGPLIDSLRARGDTLVLVSELAGITRDEAMPPLPPTSEATRLVRTAGFLAARHRRDAALLDLHDRRGARRRPARDHRHARARSSGCSGHQERGAPASFAPGVSVIVPAYNEEKVIVQTIASLLAPAVRRPDRDHRRRRRIVGRDVDIVRGGVRQRIPRVRVHARRTAARRAR